MTIVYIQKEREKNLDMAETLMAFMLHANDRLKGSDKDALRYVRASACLLG